MTIKTNETGFSFISIEKGVLTLPFSFSFPSVAPTRSVDF